MLAITRKYVRPTILAHKQLCVESGRHPVIETLLKNKSKNFIPNDISFKTNKNTPEIWLLTGPNMGGKSTFLRQIALMIIMAQAGLYVPASRYESSIFDKIFSRVGASDNLAEGKSTFMTEMTETATILTQATSQSFVILDELGRGTSTYDGLAIAWGTLKYLSETIGVMGLFATHYHELTELIQANKRIGNLQVSVSDFQGEIVFLHKIIHGSAKQSYGIHVASLAGLPLEVIQTAQLFLKNTIKNKMIKTPDISNMPLFQSSENSIIKENPIYDLIRKIDVHHLSPLEAFSLIEKIKREI
jgi:DNA mismatch repair protein MutS